MKVLLISANTEKTGILPLPLGLACVAAACRKAGHEVLLVNLMFEGDAPSAIRNAVAEFRPGVIGISVRNIDDQNMACPRFLLPPVRDVVDACRAVCDAPIVLGGAGYSIFPESALRYLAADMGIRGEGEAVFPALLECLKNGAGVPELPGLYLPDRPPARTMAAARLDDLPLPEPELWIPASPPRGDLWIPVQGKRGCPMLCSFCSTKDIQGTTVRGRRPETTVSWIEALALRGFRNFVFVDSTFNIPPSYARQLCRAIIQRGLDLNLWCILYSKWAGRELVELLARAGCRDVSLGFESGSDRMLKSYNKRFTAAEVRTVCGLLAGAGIRRTGFLLLGGPGETRETVEESLAFADSLNLEALKITVGLRIYPATALAATALAEGVIRPGDDLLRPAFYLAPALRDWLPERIAEYAASHPALQA
jgi:radical SAM superfamily enzyme YgiQ (UPF0313 family)